MRFATRAKTTGRGALTGFTILGRRSGVKPEFFRVGEPKGGTDVLLSESGRPLGGGRGVYPGVDAVHAPAKPLMIEEVGGPRRS
ncbi:MAG: hypothetical protein OXI74_14105 [Rhodospirillaceae bacterium]|nr:hypothetical protein [Rhodospirillaceae bacterium]